MTITLPDGIKAEVEREAVSAGYGSADEYVYMMYLRAKHHFGPNGEYIVGDLSDSTPERVAEFRERLADLIQEGFDSGPAVPVTEEFWASLRRRVQDRAAARGAVG